MEMEQSKQS
jgi:hypothetical protein